MNIKKIHSIAPAIRPTFAVFSDTERKEGYILSDVLVWAVCENDENDYLIVGFDSGYKEGLGYSPCEDMFNFLGYATDKKEAEELLEIYQKEEEDAISRESERP